MTPLYKDRYRAASTRLKDFDYTSAGYYFVTVCTRDRECLFGDVHDGIMDFSSVGKIVRTFWSEIPVHVPGVELDEFVVMPNHIHGIVMIREKSCRNVACNVSTDNVSTITSELAKISPKPGSLGVIIRSFKSAVTNWCRKYNHDFAWQPRFYDEIIRNEQMLEKVREYIRNNPMQWELDKENPANGKIR